MSKVIFCNVSYEGNAGDFWSSPLHYYDFSNFDYEHIGFLNERVQNEKGKIFIIGGGGLITTQNNYLTNIIKNILKGNKVIFWGIGSNTADEPYFEIFKHPNVILVGTRDITHNLDFSYVPCVSCKNKLFDSSTNTSEGVGILEHVDYQIKIDEFPKIQNNEHIDKIVEFIKSKSVIISSTFHGVYWSQLLKKRVLYYVDDGDLNSKFFFLKHRVEVCDNFNYQIKLKNMSYVENFLDESRYLNDLFYEEVKSTIIKYSN